MAPRTRRSMGAKGSLALDDITTLTATPTTSKDVKTSAVPKIASDSPKRRGRPSKASAVISDSTTSSAPTPATTVSDSEYSTPATSNAVTPAPSVPANPATSGSTRRARLVVELPDIPQDPTEPKPKGFGSLASTRSKRRGAKYSLGDSDDDDDLYGYDAGLDAIRARQLQRREYETIRIADLQRQAQSSVPVPPLPNLLMPPMDTAFADSQNVPISSTRPGKGKGKATVPTLAGKPTTSSKRTNDTISLDTHEDEEDEEDEPLAKSAPARKKQRLFVPDSDGEDSVSASDPLLTDGITSDDDVGLSSLDDSDLNTGDSDEDEDSAPGGRAGRVRRSNRASHELTKTPSRRRFEQHHPELKTMWRDLEQMPILKTGKASQPTTISRQLKPFQLEGLAWMKTMEGMKWKGGLLGDEMGLGKTIQAVSLIMSDYPAKTPSLVLVPPVALMQWTAEIESYTDGRLKTLVFHGTNSKAKNLPAKELRKFDVILMSYNSLESMYRRQEKGFKRKDGLYKEKSAIHQIKFHRVILDEAHCIKTRTTMTAKACFALKVQYRWCLTGTPLQNRIGEFFSLVRFLNVSPFTNYFCKQCPCSSLEWSMNEAGNCTHCDHYSMRHVSVFNQELLNPIQKFGNKGEGKEALQKLRLMTDRIMLRRLKKDHTNSMELPVKEIYVDRQFFGEEENDFANSIMSSGQRKFDTYVAQGVLLNNYANIFGLIMQMRQVADHPDLILKKSAEGGQNVLVCCICDEPAEEAIRSSCKHDFCRSCAKSYINSQDQPDCPQCHIPLSIDLEQPDIEQDETLVKKSSIINRIKMENWTSSSKIELLVHELHKLRSDNASHKSIIFSQFTTMLQLIEWRLRRAGITTVMLDGSMTPAQRQASINHFMTNVDVECFLVSLKAGGVALNLTEASRVFIVDPWWNPAAEWQSADRCHRIGQTRPCIITRLCIEDSVESRMVALQEKKTNMINSAINSDDMAMESLSPADLQFLFRGN